MPCTAGAVIACTCSDGAAGTATCGPAGAFGACTCASGSDTGNGSTSATNDAGTGASTTAGDGTTSACGPSFAGMVDGMSSVWMSRLTSGVMAGDVMCQGVGGDHACDYEEVHAAQVAGELDGIAPGVTAWIHRTTVATVDGVPSAPGTGGRCVDWTYGMDALADGEWVEFTADGIVYHLDPDTFYDGLDTTHADPTALPCAATTRAILCCNAACP